MFASRYITNYVSDAYKLLTVVQALSSCMSSLIG